MELKEVFGVDKPVIGVVHLLPLPGSPGFTGDLGAIFDRMEGDVVAYVEGGVDGLIVENYGDAPFLKDRVESYTVALMTHLARRVVETSGLPCGVNVLRNDAEAALSIAYATGCRFIRVNVHTGAMITDQGVIEGRAGHTLRLKKLLDASTRIFADVHVKHARPVKPLDFDQAVQDAVERGKADAVIVTGAGTGKLASLKEIARAKKSVPRTPVFVGSGVTLESLERTLRTADGVIVGSSLKRGGRAEEPVSARKVQAFMAKVLTLRGA
jgi:membrane complex biogenesis BtpA family protein